MVKYSEMPFTKTQKQSIMMTLAILAVLLCFAFLWGVSKSRKRGVIFQRRIVNSLPTVVAFVIILGVSYLHILPGSPIQHRTSPGQLLLSSAAMIQLPLFYSLLLMAVVLFSLVIGFALVLGWIPRKGTPRLSVIWFTPALLILLVDTGFVSSQDGDVATRNGSLHALHDTIFRSLGVGGCGQQPREIFVSDIQSAYQVEPKLLNGPTISQPVPGTDLRRPLMNWLRTDNVPYLDQHYINMVWVEYFGEPLLTQIDQVAPDGTTSNSESSELHFRRQLMSKLRMEFRSHNWSIRHLHELIVSSELYRLSSKQESADFEVAQLPHWVSVFPVRRLTVEQYLACVESATGGSVDFGSGYAAPDASPYQVASRFPWSDSFGGAAMRSLTTSTADRSFSSEAAMFGLVDPGLRSQIMRKDGWLAQSSSENEDVRSFIEQAYRRCFGRRPELVEIAALEATRREFGTAELFAADILWALLNSAECQYLF